MTLAQERDVWSEYQHATGADRERIEDELAREHAGLAISLARKFENVEDAEGEAFVGLLKAIRHYDPDVKTTFSTFAVPVIRNQIIAAYQKQMNGSNRAHTIAFSLNARIQDEEGKEGSIEWQDTLVDEKTPVDVQATDAVITSNTLRMASRYFNEQEALVFQRRFPKYGEPVQFESIGRELGMTGAGAINIYQNLIYKLAQCYNGMDPELIFATRRREWTKAELEELRGMILKGFSRKEIRLKFDYRTKDSMNQKITVVKKKLKKEGLL